MVLSVLGQTIEWLTALDVRYRIRIGCCPAVEIWCPAPKIWWPRMKFDGLEFFHVPYLMVTTIFIEGSMMMMIEKYRSIEFVEFVVVEWASVVLRWYSVGTFVRYYRRHAVARREGKRVPFFISFIIMRVFIIIIIMNILISGKGWVERVEFFSKYGVRYIDPRWNLTLNTNMTSSKPSLNNDKKLRYEKCN